MTEPLDLSRKKLDPQPIATLALRDGSVLRALLDGISPAAKKTAIRENSFKALMLLAERHPEALFPYWKYLVGLLNSDNGSAKYAAIHVIAALAPADDAGRFEKAFNAFYALLDDESVMVASHVAGASGKIAKARPGLRRKITRRLLEIDKTHFDASRRDLVKSYIIQAFGEYIEGSRDRAKILAFVRQQLESVSPKSRKLAKAFLARWEK